MPDDPYRPPPSVSEADAELARLAAAGQHRILEASASAAQEAAQQEAENREQNIRVALGVHYGGAAWRAVAVATGVGAVCLLMGIVGLVLDHRSVAAGGSAAASVLLGGGFGLTLVGGMVLMFLSPTASPARVAAEKAWATSLPFAMDGYFEVLAAQPDAFCRLAAMVAWGDGGKAASPETVQGVLGVLDTDARADSSAGGTTVTIRSGLISGLRWNSQSGSRSTPVWVYFNHRFVAYTHNLVDKVLMPIHRSHPIASVALSRES
jgi:hypothetical protein